MKLLFVTLLCISTAMYSQETVVSGKLLGHDGKPMPMANVEAYRMSDASKTLATAEVSADGSFRISTSERGLIRIQCSGVNHLPGNVPVLIEKPANIGLTVRLATYPIPETIESAFIIGDFNSFSMASPTPMTKQADGTFVAEFDSDKDQFKYQIFNVFTPPRSINGTQSDKYVYDGGGDYQSIVTPSNGKVRIVFDPRKVVRSDAKQEVTFDKGSMKTRLFYDAYTEVMEVQEGWRKAAMEHQKSGKDMKDFTYDVSKPLKALTEKIEQERDPYNRQLVLMQYLGVSPMAKEGVDSMLLRRALKEIPPESGLWSVSPGLILAATGRVGAGFDTESYLETFLEKNRDRMLKSIILFNQMMGAKYQQKDEQYKKYYTTLVEEYGDTQYGKLAKQRFSTESAVAVGKKVPSFKLASLEDPNSMISNDLLKGKTTLLDFWAVWCGPCIGEMENMHKAYERFKGKNFQIISFSFDAKPEDVTVFRGKKWKMPWLHAFVEKGFESDLAKRFEVMGIPKPILVDENGNILALETDLRGENLEKTLEKFLGD